MPSTKERTLAIAKAVGVSYLMRRIDIVLGTLERFESRTTFLIHNLEEENEVDNKKKNGQSHSR